MGELSKKIMQDIKKDVGTTADQKIDDAVFFVKKEKKWVALGCFGVGAMLLTVLIYMITRVF
jgi:hypothetical protein